MTECLCLGWGLVTLEDRLWAWVGGFGSHSVTWPGNWVHSHEQSVDHANMLITLLQWNLWTLKLRWASGWQCCVCGHMWAPRGRVVLTPREKDNENFLFEAHRFLICVPLPLAYFIWILCWTNHNLDYKRFLWVLESSCSKLLKLSRVLGTLWTWSCVSRESSLVKDCLLNLFILANTGQWVYVCMCVHAYYNTGVVMRTARGYNILINLRYFSSLHLFLIGV